MPVRPCSLALGVCLLLTAGGSAAHAAPPQLNLLDADPGETEVEVSGYFAVHRPDGGPSYFFNAETSHAFSDRFGLELQLTGSREDKGFEDEELSLQAFFKTADLPGGGSLGLSIEAGVGSGGKSDVGAMIYGVGSVRGWRAAFNLGAETQASGEEREVLYAWAADRPLSARWAIGAAGGGSEPFRGDEAAEHYAGPSLTWRLGSEDEAPRLRLGYLFGLTETSPDLLKVGLEISL